MDKDSKEETEAKAEVVNEELKDESQPMETSLAENIVAEQEKEEFEQMEGISSKVNQELSAQLQEMGFHKNSCEKAIFMTGNSSLEKALEWLEAHQDDPDFLDELRIVKWVYIYIYIYIYIEQRFQHQMNLQNQHYQRKRQQ